VHTITSLFARRGREATRPSCEACGRTIGMFGPVWVEHGDGTIEPASWHILGEERRHSASRVFHAGCFVPDHLPAWMHPLDTWAPAPLPSGAAHRSFRLTTTRMTAASRVGAGMLSLACAAIAALDAATVALHSTLR
jgi:hypothetical protein